MQNLQKEFSRQLQDKSLAWLAKKVLESLSEHFAGLTVFVDHPEVPIDNNKAERVQRGPVVGRKNYYGSECLLGVAKFSGTFWAYL